MRTLLLICLFLSFHSFAQTGSTPVFMLKPALGISGCQLDGDNYSGYNKFGVLAGVALDMRLKQKMSLELGFYFRQKGSRHNPNPEKGDYNSYHVKLNYIEIPLLFRYQLNPTYFAAAGPSVAYLASSREFNQYGEVTDRPFNKFETAVHAGLGRKLKEKFLIEVRYSYSFLPIRNYGLFQNNVYLPTPAANFFKPGLYNNVLTFIVYYKINKNKRSVSQPS